MVCVFGYTATSNLIDQSEFLGPIASNISMPILFVSTKYDPVCPLRSARAMSERFPGSVVLEQDSEGVSTSPSSSCQHPLLTLV